MSANNKNQPRLPSAERRKTDSWLLVLVSNADTDWNSHLLEDIFGVDTILWECEMDESGWTINMVEIRHQKSELMQIDQRPLQTRADFNLGACILVAKFWVFQKTCFWINKMAQPSLQVFGVWFEGIQKDFWFQKVLGSAQATYRVIFLTGSALKSSKCWGWRNPYQKSESGPLQQQDVKF